MRQSTIVLFLLAGCSSDLAPGGLGVGADLSSAGGGDAAAGSDGGVVDAAPRFPTDIGLAPGSVQVTSDGGVIAARPYNFKVPANYDKNVPTPLVILLHGYTFSGALQEFYFKLAPLADQKTFLYAYPDGTIDATGQRFWNATDACCNFYGSTVDDVAYVNAIIDDVEKKYNVDPKRIFLVGHSNGAFMSHRLACDAPRVAAIASLAGAVWKDASKCQPAGPVSIVEIHGDADPTILYGGGTLPTGMYPSAHDTVATWAQKNGCTGALTDTGKTLDLDTVLIGSETKVERYAGCPAAGDVELWTIQGGSHVPTIGANWAGTLYDFLSDHPKP